MSVVVQQAAATADHAGDAVFMFPDVPVGEIWIGTTSIPSAPAGAVSIVTTGGQLVGSMQGNGSYGPWISDHSKRLGILTAGLTPGTQYVAVWHADDQGRQFTTYPATITAVTVGSVVIPQPLHVDVDNFPATQPISGNVGTTPHKATLPLAGSTLVFTATPSNVVIPSAPAAVQGVLLSPPAGNVHPVLFMGVAELGKGEATLIPADNTGTGAGQLFVQGSTPDTCGVVIL